MEKQRVSTKGKILVIDDSEATLTTAKRALEASGYTVITTNSALKMPTIVRQEQPDLILLDVEMPALRGDQVMEFTHLFDFLHRSPIVFLSAKTEEELADLVKRSGADGYIKKTTNTMSFVNQVDRWMGKRRDPAPK